MGGDGVGGSVEVLPVRLAVRKKVPPIRFVRQENVPLPAQHKRYKTIMDPIAPYDNNSYLERIGVQNNVRINASGYNKLRKCYFSSR